MFKCKDEMYHLPLQIRQKQNVLRIIKDPIMQLISICIFEKLSEKNHIIIGHIDLIKYDRLLYVNMTPY